MITYQSFIMEDSTHRFSSFASDLYDDVPELVSGFPKVIQTNIGNKQPLVAKTKKLNSDGDIEYVRYSQAFGIIELKIFNT